MSVMKFYVSLIVVFFSAVSMMNAQSWLVDFEKTKAEATNKNQNIILVFQGSDWCPPCKKLEKEVWSSEAFKNYAKDHIVLLKADFPKRKKNALPVKLQQHNNELALRYNPKKRFPSVVVLNKEGKVLGQTGYVKKRSPSEYIALFKSFEE